MIPRRKNPNAPWKWQYELPGGEFTSDLSHAEQMWADDAVEAASHAAHLAETEYLWRHR